MQSQVMKLYNIEGANCKVARGANENFELSDALLDSVTHLRQLIQYNPRIGLYYASGTGRYFNDTPGRSFRSNWIMLCAVD